MRSQWRFPIFSALSALLFVSLVDWVLIPINEQGKFQAAIAWLDGVSRLVQAPGLEFAQLLGLRTQHHTGPGAWVVMMAANIPVYLATSALLRWMWWPGGKGTNRGAAVLGRGAVQGAAGSGENAWRTLPPHAPEVAPSRRQFLAAGNRLAIGGAAAVLGYSFLAEPHQFVVTHHSIPIRGLHPSLNGLTIAQLTDIHHGPWTPLSYVRRVVAATNALDVDLIALTGDYVLYSPEYIKPVVTELAELRAKVGVVGVLGNHDWWEGGRQTIEQFRRVGLPLIDNDRLFLTPDRQLNRDVGSSEGLCVAGLGDLWEGSADFGAALAGVSRHLPRLLLSHNPDAAESGAVRHGQHRVDLMLSGHTHGGQIWVPGFGTPMIPSKYGQKYASGLVRGPAFRVYISCGLGTTSVPLRFCRPPEIAVIRLEAADS